MKKTTIWILLGILFLSFILFYAKSNWIKLPDFFPKEKKTEIGLKMDKPKINTWSVTSWTWKVIKQVKKVKSWKNLENKELSIYEINKVNTKCRFPIYDIGDKQLKDLWFHFIKIENNIISLNWLEFQKVELGLQDVSLAECFTLWKMLDENKYIIWSDKYIYFISKDKLKEQKVFDITSYIEDKKDKLIFLKLFNISKIKDKWVVKFYLTPKEDINKLVFIPVKYLNSYYYITYTTWNIKQQIIPIFKLFNKYKKQIYKDFAKQKEFYKKNWFKKLYVNILKWFNYDEDFYKKYLEYGWDIWNWEYIYNQVLFWRYKGKIVCNGIVDYYDKLWKFLGLDIEVENWQAIVYDDSIKWYIKAPHSWFFIKKGYFDPTFDLSRIKAKKNIVFYNISPKCFYVNHIKQENKDNSFEIIKNFEKEKQKMISELEKNKCYNWKWKSILFYK